MPIYFNDIAPFCPISVDQPVGPLSTPQIPIRSTIPRAHDLASAIAAVNIARTIIIQLVFDKVINNVFTPPAPPPRTQPPDRIINKQRLSSWSEQTSARVKRAYKYYAVEADGEKDKDTWVMTERIEHMKWTDRGWQTSLEFIYGDKGEGEPVQTGSAGGSGGDSGG